MIKSFTQICWRTMNILIPSVRKIQTTCTFKSKLSFKLTSIYSMPTQERWRLEDNSSDIISVGTIVSRQYSHQFHISSPPSWPARTGARGNTWEWCGDSRSTPSVRSRPSWSVRSSLPLSSGWRTVRYGPATGHNFSVCLLCLSG